MIYEDRDINHGNLVSQVVASKTFNPPLKLVAVMDTYEYLRL
jgi:hypothetical protein